MKSTRDLLLKNSFRNTVVAWPVTLGLTLLIALLSLVISLMTSFGFRVVDNYNALNKASNKRDGLIALNMTDLVTPPGNDSTKSNNVENQQTYVYQLEQRYKGTKYDFDWSRTEGRNFQTVVNGNYGNLRVKIVAKTTPNSSEHKVDALAISKGRDIYYDHDDPRYLDHPTDVVLDETFAKQNNVQIGDIIRVQEDDLGNQLFVKSAANSVNQPTIDGEANKHYDAHKFSEIQKIKDLADPDDVFNKEFSTYHWLQVCGFGESADYVMPVIDSQSTLPDKNRELIAYVNPHVMGLYINDTNTGFVQYDLSKSELQVISASDEESYYSIKFKDTSFEPTDADWEKINQDFLNVTGKDKTNESTKTFVFKDGDKNYQFATRTSAIETTLHYYNLISGLILVVVGLIVIFSVVLISKKQIDKTRSQIGVMKALGYEKRKIIWNYTTMPFISSLVGGIVGFLIAQGIQGLMISMVTKYFNLAISGWSFDYIGFIVCVVLMWFVITGLGFGIAYWVMRDDTLALLNAAKASHISEVGLKVKELNKSTKIVSRTETSLFASNMGKMFSVSVIVLVATIAMTASFSLPTVLSSNQTKSYDGINYKQVVEYNKPVYNNPYTFMKTWDPTKKDQNYHYSADLQKITSEPLVQKYDDNHKFIGYGGYDMNSIMNQLASGKISSEFYDLEFGASPDEMSGDMPLNGIPNALQGMTANMKMLAMYGVTLSNKYLKTISDWAIKDPFGWNILANQWPDYLTFTQSLRNISSSNDSSNFTLKQWEDTYGQLQAFYKKYIESVGLVITRDYYDYNRTDDKGVARAAYENKDYVKQIQLFNANKDGIKQAFNSYTSENANNGGAAFGKLLTSQVGDTPNDDFQISDGTKGLAINHIYNPDHYKNDGIDRYLTDSADQVIKQDAKSNSVQDKINALKSRIKDYLTWYGAYLSERSGTAIVMAGFSRPPYFVQQYAKKAYYANDDKDIYRFAFSSAPYNPDTDQLGTEIEAYAFNGKHRTDFKIYGIQNNNRFVDLRDTDGNNLVNKLFTDTESNDQYDIPGIVINQSLATKLNVSDGQEIDTKVLFDELEEKNGDDNTAFRVDDWNQSNPRSNIDPSQGFITSNDMDTFNISVKTPSTKKDLAFTAGNSNLTNAPSEFYKQWIAGNVYNKQNNKPQKFKIVGVHKGYGTPMAWVRNQDAENVMKYDKVREWLWNNLFIQQFGTFFKDAKNGAPDYQLSTNKDGYSVLYDDKTQSYLKSYDDFMAYLNGDFALSSSDRKVAQRIMNVFNNAYPIYNYKYSMSDDIGDLQAAVSTWDETGGYSPIEENGGVYVNGKDTINLDGIGKGAIAYLLPIDITKQIQDEISSVIMSVVAIIICLVVLLTFIIIMLTTSLIINDNSRFISTMKVLGYSTPKIVNIILGMYAIAIVCAFVVGFIAGWFILAGTVRSLALASTMVLPLFFPAWLIFAVIAAVIGIYAITFTIGFLKIKNANPLDSLKDQEL